MSDGRIEEVNVGLRILARRLVRGAVALAAAGLALNFFSRNGLPADGITGLDWLRRLIKV